MEKINFSTATFETVQNLVYPLLLTLFDIDVASVVADKAEIFNSVGDAFGDISTLFLTAGAALQDGRLTEEELNDIIAKAKTLPQAIDEILSHFGDKTDPEG